MARAREKRGLLRTNDVDRGVTRRVSLVAREHRRDPPHALLGVPTLAAVVLDRVPPGRAFPVDPEPRPSPTVCRREPDVDLPRAKEPLGPERVGADLVDALARLLVDRVL